MFTAHPLHPRLLALGLLTSIVTTFGAVAPAAAQPGGPGASRATNALSIGVRGGYDFTGDAPLVGAYLRSDLVWRFALQATGDLAFLDGLTERQAGADLLVRLRPGLNLGGGVVARNTIFELVPLGSEVTEERETKIGFSVVGVLGGIGSGRFINALELRYTSVGDFDSQLLALQVGIPLFRW